MFEIFGVKVKFGSGVYEPEEDSFLLAGYLNKLDFRGKKVLEIGGGTGIQALICAKKGGDVEVVDVNDKALSLMKENRELNDLSLRVYKSDLFENTSGKWDCIIFNTPYLPEDYDFKDDYSKAWDGGKDGRMVIDMFLNDSLNYLKNKGHIIMVQSSLSEVEKTLRFFNDNGFRIVNVLKERFDFEEVVLIDAVFEG